MSDSTPIVLDNGSDTCKAGFAGDHAPRVVFPSVIGRYRREAVVVSMRQVDYYLGHEAQKHRDLLDLKRLVSNGMIADWDDIERLWHHVFYNELRAAPDEHAVLLSEAPMTPKASRERMVQTMFETFRVPAYCVSPGAALALHATGRTTGVVIDSGDDTTASVPILEGQPIQHAILRLDLAGHGLTQALATSLARPLDAQVVRDAKETLCYVSLEFGQGAEAAYPAREYTLPDGQTISVGNERFQVPEALFDPCLAHIEKPGLHEVVNDTICRVDIDLRQALRQNIVLCGGTSLLPGLAERMQKELVALAPYKATVNIDTSTNRKYLTWVGGSMFASLSTFQDRCWTREEYDEEGASIVHRK